jgi:hypothetical protein
MVINIPLWKTVWSFLKKSKIELPYDVAIQLLSIYPKDLNLGSQRYFYSYIHYSKFKIWK